MALTKITTTNTYNLEESDRPYDDEEIESENQATKFPINIYKRIKPVHGTLGYAFRNIVGRNHVVIEALKNVGVHQSKTHRFIKEFIILWNNMDEYSRKRVDIFDWLCEKYDINKAKFFGIVQEGMFNFNNLMAQTALSGFTPEFIEIIKRMAKKEKNIGDRQLFAKMAGLTSEAPILQLNDNSTNTKNELHLHEASPLPSFANSMRKSDEGVRTISSAQQKALTEGNQNYIDAEMVSEPEKELLTVEQRVEENFKKAARELT